MVCLLCACHVYYNSSAIESRKGISEMLKSLQTWLVFTCEGLENWNMAELIELLYTCCGSKILQEHFLKILKALQLIWAMLNSLC